MAPLGEVAPEDVFVRDGLVLDLGFDVSSLEYL
jgi:hypothetical protein